jgi:hypothetical protein
MRKSRLAFIFLVICPLLVAQQPQPPVAEAPSAIPQAALSTPPPPHTLLDGTPVKLRLSQTISSADTKVGQEIPFEVVEDISVDQVVVLPKGATAIANVTTAQSKKSMGRGGKLDIAISYARLKDQEKVALRASQESKGGGHVGAITGAMVATSVAFFPAAPLFLFIKGKDITIPQGTQITAFVEGDMHLNMANFGVAPPRACTSASPSRSCSSLTCHRLHTSRRGHRNRWRVHRKHAVHSPGTVRKPSDRRQEEGLHRLDQDPKRRRRHHSFEC